MHAIEKKIMFVLSKILRFADKLIGTTDNRRACILDTIPYIKDLSHLEGAVDLYGNPFYFDMLKCRYAWVTWLIQTIVKQDYYLLNNIKDSSPVILDVGAHIGTFSRHVLGKKPNATVYAFEPDADSFSILEKNLNRFEKGIAIHKGILDKKGSLDFYKPFGGHGWCGMPATGKQFLEMKESEGDSFSVRHKIGLIDIDSFCDENNVKKVSLIKIHVGGKTEHRILLGAEKTINKYSPQMGIEAFPENMLFINKFLTDKGYKEMPSLDKGEPPFLRLYIPQK